MVHCTNTQADLHGTLHKHLDSHSTLHKHVHSHSTLHKHSDRLPWYMTQILMKIAGAEHVQEPKALITHLADSYNTVNNTNIGAPRAVFEQSCSSLCGSEAGRGSGGGGRKHLGFFLFSISFYYYYYFFLFYHYLMNDSGELDESMESEVWTTGFGRRWCFKPSQPQRITSGLNTNFTITPS